jgi:hypothetical protein
VHPIFKFIPQPPPVSNLLAQIWPEPLVMSNLSGAWEKSVFSRFPGCPASEGHTRPGSLTHLVLELLLPMVNSITGGDGVGGGVGGTGVGEGVGPELTWSNKSGDLASVILFGVAVSSNIVVTSDTVACGICA